jgi:predicted nucleotidyltransferase
MVTLTREQRERIDALCREHRVRTLHLFGSAVGDAFDPGRSDIDVLVSFEEAAPASMADRFFGLWEGLQEVFGREVDLVVDDAIRNRYFRAEVDRTKQPLYAA